MFSFSPTAVSILIAFGAIAVIWALVSYALGRQGFLQTGVLPNVNSVSHAWRGKITSPSEKKQSLAVRENLLRLMMIFERPVVKYFSFRAMTFSLLLRRLEPFLRLRLIFLQTLKQFCPKFFCADKPLRFIDVKPSLMLKRLYRCLMPLQLSYVYVRNSRNRQL